MFSCEFCEIFKNTCFYRTTSVAASHYDILKLVTINCFCGIHTFFYKQHFYKQRQAETGKKMQILSNTLRLNFCYLKIIHTLHPCYHPKIIVHILKNKQKKKYFRKNEDENEKQNT